MADVQPTNPAVLSPALLRTPIAGPYLVAPQWARWLQASWGRQGGAQAPSNAELDTAQQATQTELDATQGDLAQTQADLASTQADLAATQGDLAGTQGDLAATQAELAAKLPDGTPLSVARYQADGSGVESTPGLLTTPDGRVGVGLAPDSDQTLQVAGPATIQRDGGNAILSLRSYGGTNARVIGQTVAGTLASPSPTPLNNQLLRLEGRGYDGSTATEQARLDLTAAETWTPTAKGTRLVIATTLTGATALQERLRIDGNGFLGVGGVVPTARLDVNGDTIRLRTAKTPASATAAGNPGDICWSATHLFICVAVNTWRRVAHETWV